MSKLYAGLLVLFPLLSCHSQSQKPLTIQAQNNTHIISLANHTSFDTSCKTIHVFVALCDNKYQGIVPVPAMIGNGQDPDNNLYWGCDAGIRTWFKRSKEWTFLTRHRVDSCRLERLVFKHKTKKYYLVADAYDGRYIRQCTVDFLHSCAGQLKDTLHIKGMTIGINGNAKLLSYIGHDGLMDFRLKETFQNTDSIKRDAIILACISKKYFSPFLAATRANPLVWTTGLMCPEAYTLHDALNSYIRNEPVENIRSSAAKAYSKNQRCGEKAARNLLVSGW